MADKVAIVLDCGSTNATVIAVDPEGRIVASASRPSDPTPQPGCPPGWVIWDLEGVFGKLADACEQVCGQVRSAEIVAVTITTSGADGAPMAAHANIPYPVICWQDARTEPLHAVLHRREERESAFDALPVALHDGAIGFVSAHVGQPFAEANFVVLRLRAHAHASLAFSASKIPGALSPSCTYSRSVVIAQSRRSL